MTSPTPLPMPPPGIQTVQDLGRLVKAKHPEYGDMDDITLGQKVKAKHPEYSDFQDMMPLAPSHVPQALQGAPDNAPHGFWESLKANNPITAVYNGAKEYLQRPSELAKADQALGVLQSKPSGGFNDAENATIDAGMNANLSGAEDSSIPLTGPAMGATQQAMNGDVSGAAGTLTGSYVAPAVAGYGLSKLPNPVPPGLRTPEGRMATTRAGIEALPNGSKALKFVDLLRKGPEAPISPADLADYAKKSGISIADLNAMKPDELTKFISKATDAVKVMKANEATRSSVAAEMAPKPVLNAPPRTPAWQTASTTPAPEVTTPPAPMPAPALPSGRKPGGYNPANDNAPVSSTPKPTTSATLPKPPAKTPADIVLDYAKNSGISSDQLAHMSPEEFQQFTANLTKAHKQNELQQSVIGRLRVNEPTPEPSATPANGTGTGQAGTPVSTAPTPAENPSPAPALPPTPGMVQQAQAHKTKDNVNNYVERKKANLADYMRTKGITPEAASSMSIDERNQVLKDAHAHGKAKGVTVPKDGYRLFDPTNSDTWDQAVEMLRSYQLTPPPTI